MNFIDSYMEYTTPLKGYRPFHMWSCLSLIAAALGRKAYIQRKGGRKTFANMYIVLIGPAGLGKSESIKVVSHMIRDHNKDTEVQRFKKQIVKSSTKMTPAALIESLCEINLEPTENNPNALGRDRAELFIPSSEFAVTFSDIGGGSLLVDLLDLFDCPDTFDKRTRMQGREVAYNTSLNILGASVAKTLRKLIPLEATGTGFSARVIFVNFDGNRSDLSNRAIAQPEWMNYALYGSLVNHVKAINLLEGPMTETPEALKYIDSLSDQFFIEAGHMAEGSLQQDFRTRKSFHCMKVAICLAASRLSMEITKQDYEQALMIINTIEPHISSIFGAVNYEYIETGSYDFLELIPYAPLAISVPELKKLAFTQGQIFMNAFQFDSTLSALQSSNLINIKKEDGKAMVSRKL